jgi:hypothetical protein
MSDDKLTLALKLIAENGVFKAVLGNSESAVNRFVNGTKAQIESLRGFMHSAMGKIAGVGLGFGAFEIAKGAAAIDAHLTRISLSAGKSKADVKELREQLQGLGAKTGQNVGELANGFERLFNLAGDWDIARAAIQSVNTAVKVTTANTDTLSEALSIAQTSFGMDLSKKGAPSEILNKMQSIAPGAGGLQNVASIFNSIAPMAALSGMNFDSSIKLIGMISNVTKNPEQMGELASQSLRLFTNLRAITNKKGTLGKVVFDENGERRDPIEVLKGIKTLYDSLSSKKQIGMLTALTGGADPRSTRIIQMLLKSNALNKGDAFQKKLDSSTNGLENKLPEALNNANDQAARLKNVLTDAGEDFARPIDRAVANTIKFGMDKANLSGRDVAALGVAAAGTAWLGSNMIKGTIGKFLGGKASLAGGIAEGAMVSRVGVTSVYVVNFGEMGSALGNSPAGKFQEYLPGDNPAQEKGISKSVLSFAQSGPIVIAAAAIAASLWAGSQEKYRKVADALRGGNGLQGGFASGSGSGSTSGRELSNSEGFGGAMSPSSALHHETNVTVYVDNEKKKPSKTIVDGRGSFVQ